MLGFGNWSVAELDGNCSEWAEQDGTLDFSDTGKVADMEHQSFVDKLVELAAFDNSSVERVAQGA